MTFETIQVRDVSTEDAEELRRRAAARDLSLSAFLREMIRDETSRPAMADVLARVATRTSVEVSTADIRSFIDDDRKP